MVEIPSFFSAGVLVLLGALAGATGHLHWTRRAAGSRDRIPKHWPLDPRRIVNSQELQVWRWLVKTFPDHPIMVKMPITRFTAARTSDSSVRLHQLLTQVYCTFAVCTPGGEVIGCIDVRDTKPPSRSNQLLKLRLLSQCDVCYWIVDPGALPDPADVRAYFLAEDGRAWSHAQAARRTPTNAEVNLRATVERQRHFRRRSPDAGLQDGPDTTSSDFSASQFAADPFRQTDSFLAPLDSRRLPLS